jgi:AhpD family alkylhydroperoxidase
MPPGLNPFTAVPAAPGPMLSWIEFSKGTLQCGLEDRLVRLVTIRVSQIKGCAASIDTHTAAARELGETEQRLYLLDAWRVSPLYSERECAALGWTEALTRLSETHAPEDDYLALREQFTGEERVNLTLLIIAINGWNCFRAVHPAAQRKPA